MMLTKMRELEEEDPQLHVAWDEHLQEIQVQLMGEIQIQVLKSLIETRFGVAVDFGRGNIVYKETIADKVEGVGILSLFAITLRFILYWSPEREEADCSFPLCAVKMYWIGTGRD